MLSLQAAIQVKEGAPTLSNVPLHYHALGHDSVEQLSFCTIRVLREETYEESVRLNRNFPSFRTMDSSKANMAFGALMAFLFQRPTDGPPPNMLGRWGYRKCTSSSLNSFDFWPLKSVSLRNLGMFECDQDIDIALELNEIIPGQKLELSHMIHQTDHLAPPDCREFYKTPQYKADLAIEILRLRVKLDSGLGQKMMDLCRAQESSPDPRKLWIPKYVTCVAGALLMRAGAKISDQDKQYIRDSIPEINCNYGFTVPPKDLGFRSPGKLQLLAALDNYVPGTPRKFDVPSCFSCGKIETDTGRALRKCSHCQRAWYCDRVSRETMQVPGHGYTDRRTRLGMPAQRSKEAQDHLPVQRRAWEGQGFHLAERLRPRWLTFGSQAWLLAHFKAVIGTSGGIAVEKR